MAQRLSAATAAVLESLETRRFLSTAPLYAEGFDEPSGSRSGTLAGGGTWSSFTRNVGPGFAGVSAGAFNVAATAGVVSWYTSPLDIAGGPVNASLTLASTSTANGKLTVLARVDGQTVASRTLRGPVAAGTPVTFENLTGSKLQVEVQVDTRVGGYSFDNLDVSRPATPGVGVTAVRRDRVLTVTGTAGRDVVDLQSIVDESGPRLAIYTGGRLLATYGGLDALVVDLGAGDDTLTGYLGFQTEVDDARVTLRGGDGNDRIVVEAEGVEGGPDTRVVADGGAGNDVVTLRSTDPTYSDIFGGAGNDVLSGDQGTGVYGGAGNDTIAGSGAWDENVYANLGGGDGDDVFLIGDYVATTSGDGGNDYFILEGSFYDGTIRGGEGDDELWIDDPYRPYEYSGGAGRDVVNYGGLEGEFGVVPVTFDDVRNDGPGRNANVRSDVEAALQGGDGEATAIEFTGSGARSGSFDGGTWTTFAGNLGTGSAGTAGGRFAIERTAGVVAWYTSPIDLGGRAAGVTMGVRSIGSPSGSGVVIARVDGRTVASRRFTGAADQVVSFDGLTGSTLKLEFHVDSRAGGYSLGDVSLTLT